MEIINITIKQVTDLLVSLWALTFALILISASILKAKGKSWANFLGIYFFALVISGIVLFFMISNPEAILNFIEKVKGFF